jgi:hypothetical protein
MKFSLKPTPEEAAEMLRRRAIERAEMEAELRVSEGADFERLTDAQFEVLRRHSPKVRGRTLSTLLEDKNGK